MEKTYKLGLLVGRFQALHLGHERMIRDAIALCGRVAVFIGSSQESGTQKNPFSYETRERMLKAVFGDAIEVYPLPDAGLGNNRLWGQYVLDRVNAACGRKPDLFITGREERRVSWFEDKEDISELVVPKVIEASATQMREYLARGEEEAWKALTPRALHPMFHELRSEVLKSEGNSETQSI